MKNTKVIIGSVTLVWLIVLAITFSNTFYWYAYLILTGTALVLSFLLLVYLRNNNHHIIEKDEQRKIANDEPLSIPHLFNRIKKKKKKRKPKQPPLKITTDRNQVKSVADNNTFMTPKTKMSSVKNKRYLHTKIPQLFQGETQKTLFETIQRLKGQHFFSNFYGDVTNEELVDHFETYENRPIFELYDQTLPNTFAKTLYDPDTETNRIAIFLSSHDQNSDDIMLGFIEMEDTYKANLLMQRYENIQVFTTILGGTYKKVYRNSRNEVKIIKDFINYDLTISLAFYN